MVLGTDAYPLLTETKLSGFNFRLSTGAARGIRTPDPIITKRGIGAAEGCTAVRSGTRKCAVVRRRMGVPATPADVRH
jgi:hypothetical protein